MKKILLIVMSLVLIVGSMGCESNAAPVNKVEPQTTDSPYMYEGTIIEIVNNNDQETEVIEGTLVMEIELDNQKYTIAVHVTEKESSVDFSAYEIGEIVNIITTYKINLEGADELAHIKVITIEQAIIDPLPIDVTSDSPYMYEGTILEIVNNNDQDTEVIDGTLVMEVELDNQKYTIAVHVTEKESPVALSTYEIGEIVNIITPFEVNLEGANELAHIEVITVEKFIVDAPVIDASSSEAIFEHTGVVKEIVEGTLALELEDSTTIFIYITPEMSSHTADEYVVGEEVLFTVDYELDFEEAIDIPHVSPLTLEKIN